MQVSLPWYDLDFPEVIDLRRAYYPETEQYHLIAAPALPTDWLEDIPHHTHALVIAEGLSMYLSEQDMRALMAAFCAHFDETEFIFDAYSPMAAKLSKWKNPINAVDARIDFAMDDPALLEGEGSVCALNSNIITPDMVARLRGVDRLRFRFMGEAGKNFYRIFGYRLTRMQQTEKFFSKNTIFKKDVSLAASNGYNTDTRSSVREDVVPVAHNFQRRQPRQ